MIVHFLDVIDKYITCIGHGCREEEHRRRGNFVVGRFYENKKQPTTLAHEATGVGIGLLRRAVGASLSVESVQAPATPGERRKYSGAFGLAAAIGGEK